MRAILTYHSIDPSGSPISLAPEVFRLHVAWLASRRVRVLPLEHLVDGVETDDAVALTFDDAIENFLTVAWPVLREHRLPVTLFVPTGHVGGTNAWPGPADPAVPTLPLLGWEALGRLAEQGVSLGSHGRFHRDLRTLAAEELAGEFDSSADRIESETGTRPRTFAYPYGLFDDTVSDAARRVYRFACTTELRTLRPGREDPVRLPRLDAFYLQRAGLLESWGSLRFRGYVRLRAVARAGRGLLRGGRP